jgi:hypothetical protein
MNEKEKRTWIDVFKQEQFETEALLKHLRMIIIHRWNDELTLYWLGHEFKIKYEGEIQK